MCCVAELLYLVLGLLVSLMLWLQCGKRVEPSDLPSVLYVPLASHMRCLFFFFFGGLFSKVSVVVTPLDPIWVLGWSAVSCGCWVTFYYWARFLAWCSYMGSITAFSTLFVVFYFLRQGFSVDQTRLPLKLRSALPFQVLELDMRHHACLNFSTVVENFIGMKF